MGLGIFSRGVQRSFMSASSSLTRTLVPDATKMISGQMKEIEIGPYKVLLCRTNDGFHAIPNQCSHYKAPLIKGSLSTDGKIVCPWHAACFDVKTGDIEDGPGLLALKPYKVEQDGEDVFILTSEEDLKNAFRSACEKMIKSPSDEHLVIVGGGAAGATAAHSAREAGFKGRITMITSEFHVPYDRIKLSKILGPDPKSIQLFDQACYESLKVELKLGMLVENVDFKLKTISIKDQEIPITYDKVILASGGTPRTFPQVSAENMLTLRSIGDSARIKELLETQSKPNVIVIGSSFIGLEAAAAISGTGKAGSITVIGVEKAPLEGIFGSEIGLSIKKLHEEKGVKFSLNSLVKDFEIVDGQVKSVKLNDGNTLQGDIFILGIGVTPATDYIKLPGFLQKDKSILVDECMRVVGVDDAFAVGDIARFPASFSTLPIRIEHWNVALDQGRIAGHNAAISDAPKAYQTAPFFWTMQYGKSLRFVGSLAEGGHSVFIKGDPLEYIFEAYYHRDGEIVAVATMGADPLAAHVKLLMEASKMPDIEYVQKGNSILDIMP